ncbi:MAG TPA: YciI family protein [Spirochaetia bacterium]|nr:YciI family protein [Spirochaetia bacterium]
MAQFIFFLRGSSAEFRKMSPDEIQRTIQKYDDWAKSLASRGKLRGGEKLKDDGVRTIRLDNGKVVMDGPFPETKETIGGYFIVEAADYDEAADLARSCPVYASGGTVEVRQVDPIPSMAP